MRYYIATRLSNRAQHNELRDVLEVQGHEITFDWTTLPDVWGDTIAREVCDSEIDGVLTADVVIVLLPGGRGTHVDLGAAIAGEVPVILWSEESPVLPDQIESCLFYRSRAVELVTGSDFVTAVLGRLDGLFVAARARRRCGG